MNLKNDFTNQKSHLTDVEEEMKKEVSLTDLEIFTQIWFSPRKVFRFIYQTKYQKYFFIILILGCFSMSYSLYGITSLTEEVIKIIFLCLLYYVYGILLSWTGKWLKGESEVKELVSVLVYGMIPSIVVMLIILPLYLFEIEMDFNNVDMIIDNKIIIGVFVLFPTVFAIWSLVLMIVGIAETQNFSIGKAIINMLLPFVFLATMILAISLPFMV